jgi:hypothetical protein
MKVMEECYGQSDMAVAFIERPSQSGPLSERVMVSTGQGSATVVLFWAPSANFQAEDLKLTKGQPSCARSKRNQLNEGLE